MTDKLSAKEKIGLLVDRFEEQFESYKNPDYNETLTRRDFIDPFFKALGWDIDNEAGYAEAYREVIHEDKIKVSGSVKITSKSNTNPYFFDNAPYVADLNNYWNDQASKPAVSALWAVQQCYDYFHNEYGRHGMNGNNLDVHITANYNGFWSGYQHTPNSDNIAVGYYNDTSFAAIDIMGHEFTHGITVSTANFDYVADESGALHEGFSDIFGEAVEDYANGSCDWQMGGDFFTFRSLDNPHQSHYRINTEHGHQPAYYHEPGYWTYTTDTNVYVHKNCSVLTYWFYLLVTGNQQLGVSGIGMDHATWIAYRALTLWLWDTPNADFEDAREACIAAAEYTYGKCYAVYIEVMDAWAAVGIGDPCPDPCETPLESFIEGPYETSCGNTEYWSTTTTGGSGNYRYEWYYRDESYQPQLRHLTILKNLKRGKIIFCH